MLLVAGCWLLVAGCWLLVAGFWLLVTGYYVQIKSYRFLVTSDQQPETSNFWLFCIPEGIPTEQITQ